MKHMKEYEIDNNSIKVAPNRLGYLIEFEGKEYQIISEYLYDETKPENERAGAAIYLSNILKKHSGLNERTLKLFQAAIERSVQEREPSFFLEFE